MSAVDDRPYGTSPGGTDSEQFLAGSGAALGADPATAGAGRPSSRGSTGNVVSSIVGPLVFLVLFIGLWEYFHRDGMRRFFDKPGFLLPSLATVVDQGFLDSVVRDQYITGLAWTTFAAVIGLSISIVLGIVARRASWPRRGGSSVRCIRTWWRPRRSRCWRSCRSINSVFGGGMGARIFVCVMISIFPIVTNTLFGLTSVDTSKHDLFTLRGASRRTRLRKLQFPAAMPSIFIGFRIAAGLSRHRRHRRRTVLPLGPEAGHRHRGGAVPRRSRATRRSTAA